MLEQILKRMLIFLYSKIMVRKHFSYKFTTCAYSLTSLFRNFLEISLNHRFMMALNLQSPHSLSFTTIV